MIGLDKLNGATRIVAVLVFVVTTTIAIETRYAKGSDVEKVEQSTSTMLQVLTLQYLSRKTVLELKEAQDGALSPAEQVELKSLYEILTTLEKR